MNIKSITYIFFLFISQLLFSQEKNDSIILEKLHFYRDINNDSTLFYANKLKNSSNVCSQLGSITAKAYIYHKQKKYTLVIDILNKLSDDIDLFIKEITPSCYLERKMAIHNRLFWAYKNLENYNEAYKQILKLESLITPPSSSKNLTNYRNYLGIYINKATIKENLNMHDEAFIILKQALSEFNSPMVVQLNNDNFIVSWKASILNSLGNTYINLSKKNNNLSYLDSASYYYDKAYETTKLFNPPHKDSEIIYNFRKTEVLIAQKKYNEALKLINNYKNISNGYHYKHREFFQKAICFNNLNLSDSTLYYTYKLLSDKKEECKRSNLITMYDILSKQYNKLQKADSAFKYSQKTIEQYNLANKNKEDTFHLLYKNDFNEAIELNKKLILKGEQNKTKLYSIIGSSTILVSLLFFFFYKKEKKKKKILLDKIQTYTSEETQKKEYNIDSDLEIAIINEIDRINNNLDYLKHDFSITTISEKLNTNSTYVSFVFNNTKGETFKQYYTRLKIDYIKQKLTKEPKYRNYNIKALAEEIGYSNASAFSRAFKKQTGITPSEFINNIDS